MRRVPPVVVLWGLSACALPAVDEPIDIGRDAPDQGDGSYAAVHANVAPLLGNAPLRVTVTSTLGGFIAQECDLRVLGVSTGANVGADEVEVEVDVTSSVALVCERGADVDVDEHLVDLSSIDSFVASPPFLVPGKALSLSWTGQNLAGCEVTTDGGKSAVVLDELGAHATHVPSGATTYTLSCDGLGGPISRTLVVEELDVRVAAPPYVTFGGDLLLTVGVPAAASCAVTAEPPLPYEVTTGPVDEDLRIIFFPDVDTPRTYTVSCGIGNAIAQAATALVDVAPLVRHLDVKDVSAAGITLEWTAVGAAACALDNGASPDAQTLPIALDAEATNPFGVEAGLVTYGVHCTSSSGLPADAHVTVAWGDVTSPADLFGVRAVTGSVSLAGNLPSGSLRFDDVNVIVGNLSVHGASAPDALIFVGLGEVRGDVAIEDVPNVSRLLFPVLGRARSLTIKGAPLLTCADVAPVQCGFDPPLDPAALDVTPACTCPLD